MIAALLIEGAPTRPPQPARLASAQAPAVAEVAPAPAPPSAAPAAPVRESWPSSAYLEAGSATLQARLESEWGGLAELGRDHAARPVR